MSIYDYPYDVPAVRRTSPVAWMLPLLAVIAFGSTGLGSLAYFLWPGKSASGLVAEAGPRPVTPRGELAADDQATIALFKTVSPSVVHITNLASQRDRFTFDVRQVPRGSGTGFVWDTNGFVVTNYHVVDGASTVRVILTDQSSFDSDQVWGYPDKDLAVIRINAPKEKLKPIAVGTSHDLQVGQKTFAIGNPFGLDHSLTTGIVSALGREIDSANGRPIRGVIQTSAAINPGNSGGPLLDGDGRLIGVNTAILSPSGAFAGIGFAIPVDEVNRVVPQLIAHGKVVRPRLGVQIAEDEQARQLGVTEANRGALVIQVPPGTPAHKAGLRGTTFNSGHGAVLGDIIVAVDGKPVLSGGDLFSVLEGYNPGDTVTVTYLRNGERQVTKATLEVAP
jgi:S1-C subfamily serine protease